MGTGEAGTPMKAAKVDQQPAPTSYPEWAAAFQAYYNSGGQPPPGYFPPAVVSGPQPHPYMWGGQPMMPPYGTPPPGYGAMYPHGGMFAHPSLPPGSHPYGQYGTPAPGTAMIPAGAEADGNRGPEIVKERSPLKSSKGNLGGLAMVTGRGGESGKGNSGSANGAFSQSSGESGTDGSSDGSEEDSSQNMLRKRSFDQMPGDSAGIASGTGMVSYNPETGGTFVGGSGGAVSQPLSGSQLGIPGKASGVGGTTTDLGMGVQDYWSGSNPGAAPGGKAAKRTSTSTSGGMDEREVKRLRRKQSNRESARRSRLRKQAECEELGTRVDTLTVENVALRTELARVSEDCKKLTSDHASLLQKLRKYQVEDTMLAPEQDEDDKHEGSAVQPEGNGKVEEGCNVGSPGNQVNMRGEESSFDSPGKLPSTLDERAHPETIGSG